MKHPDKCNNKMRDYSQYLYIESFLKNLSNFHGKIDELLILYQPLNSKKGCSEYLKKGFLGKISIFKAKKKCFWFIIRIITKQDVARDNQKYFKDDHLVVEEGI